MSKTVYVFTYGTLMSLECRNSVMLQYGAKYCCDMTLDGYKMVTTNDFPVILDSDNDKDSVTGELYKVPDAAVEPLLRILDGIEAVGFMYERRKYEDDKKIIYCYVGLPMFWQRVYTRPMNLKRGEKWSSHAALSV